MNLSDLVERHEVIDLPRKSYELLLISGYAFLFLLFFSLSFNMLLSFGIWVFYSHIGYIIVFISSLGFLTASGYFLVNLLFFQHPILVLSPRHVYSGTKNLFRTPALTECKVKPDRDLSLVIVRDSRSKKYRVILEERVLIDLCSFSKLDKAQEFRESLKRRMSKFYPQILVSLPIYQSTYKNQD